MSSPYINRFLQPDTLIPGVDSPQSWNRYGYVSNNPVRFNDPTGHKEADEVGGGIPCYPGELACQLKKSGYKPKSKEEIAKDLRLERPISGLHLGVSAQKGLFKEKGGYLQVDFLMDWKNGTLYTMVTGGAYDVIGTPTGGDATVYGGWTNVHGIPLYGEEDISDDLAGKNIDGALSIGADVFGKLSATKGISIDVDDSFQPIHTGAGLLGYQYATENTLEAGINLTPNELEVSGEGGVSISGVSNKYKLPQWPFR